MSLYSIALFLHIVGAIVLFAGINLELLALRGLRRADTSAAFREWLDVMRVRRRMEAPAGLTLFVTGGYMTPNWGRNAWIGLALLALVLIAVLGAVGTGRAARALLTGLPTDDRPVPLALRQRLDGPVFSNFPSLRVALALGVVFVMTVKPAASGAVLALGTALVLGAIAPWIRSHGALAGRESFAEH